MQDFLQTIPHFTLFYGCAVLGLGLIVTLRLVDPSFFIYDPELVFKRGEIWRLFTAPFYFGCLDFNLVFYIVASLSLIMSLETTHFNKRLSNFVFIFILNAITATILSTIFVSYALGKSVLVTMEYLFSKILSQNVVRLFMIIPIPAQYLPFVYIFLEVSQGQSIIPTIIGIVSGHIVFYTLFILPVEIGRPVLKCPQILVDLLDENQVIMPQEVQRPQNPMNGRGRRIGD